MALLGLVTFAGITFSHIHTAIQEAAVLRQHGVHPATRLIVHRWFPYGGTTMSYDPYLEIWIGDD